MNYYNLNGIQSTTPATNLIVTEWQGGFVMNNNDNTPEIDSKLIELGHSAAARLPGILAPQLFFLRTASLLKLLRSFWVIAISERLKSMQKWYRKVRYVKRNVSFLDEDIPLLQSLDALRDIKIIPDSNPDDSFNTLKGHIANLSNVKKERLVSLAFSFNPGTRALLGALIENYFRGVSVSKLKQSINRLSSFETGVSSELLRNKQSWNLI